jgi:hypothetical protein
MKRIYFISAIVDLRIRMNYITFIYNIVLLLNILFRYNTLFTYTIKNILLIIGSVFLGPDEHLQGFECPVAVWSVIRDHHLSSQHQGDYILLTENVTQLKPDSTR